jgi:predicted esterase
MHRSLCLLFLLLFAAPAVAQPERDEFRRRFVALATERYELGRRLKAFEVEWEKHDSPAVRERALAVLPKFTKQFRADEYGEAGRTLDLAAYSLTTDILPSAGRQWVWSLYAVPEVRVVDGSAKEISVTIQPLYPVKGDLPKGLELQLWFTNKDVVKVKPEKFPLTVKVPLQPLGEFPGLDRKLYFLVDGAKELRPSAIGISQIANLHERLEKLAGAIDKAKDRDAIETLTANHRMLQVKWASESTPLLASTDMPYADLLANAETMLDGKPFFTPARHGQFWITVRLGPMEYVNCRVFIPKGLDKAKPVPVVFALHGHGGDVNTFFEECGSGQIVKECEKRGWVLVCPPSQEMAGPVGPRLTDLFEKLADRYPLDPKRVFVIGHEDGAACAIRQAGLGKLAAVAALGGGSKIEKKEAFATLPVFIGVGDKDSFALPEARALNKSLTDAGAKAVTYKEYENLEHLVIVREALPDVFAMLDKVAGK